MALFRLSEQQVNVKFRQFADSLKADDDYHDEGIRLCENVRRHLEQQSKFQGFSIHSTIYGGSIGKKTDVQTPDFDITMKINNRRPPFNDVLDFFERELKQNAAVLKVDLRSRNAFKRTRFSVQFAFTDGKEVDLLPAFPNWTLEDVLRELKRNPKMRRYYSSTLVDSKVQFMKDQGAFAHAMARLSKFWYKNMDLGDEYLSAGSTIFELMGVATTLNGEESMMKRFDGLIKMVENFEHIKLSFEKPHYGSWRVSGYNSFPPYVLDPSNPQDNLLRGTKPHVLTLIQNNGKAMRQRFTKFQNKMKNNQLGDIDTEIKLLFKA